MIWILPQVPPFVECFLQFDKKIDGKYWGYYGNSNKYITWSEDLINWHKEKETLIEKRKGYFDDKPLAVCEIYFVFHTATSINISVSNNLHAPVLSLHRWFPPYWYFCKAHPNSNLLKKISLKLHPCMHPGRVADMMEDHTLMSALLQDLSFFHQANSLLIHLKPLQFCIMFPPDYIIIAFNDIIYIDFP